MTATTTHIGGGPGFFAPTLGNWRLALLIVVIVVPSSVWLLPLNVAYWVSFAAVAVVAISVVVNAWGRHTGPLLVAPAITLLFVMNIFPLMWSFGLSFFRFRVNRLAPPKFAGLANYEKVLTDPNVWDRLQTTALPAGRRERVTPSATMRQSARTGAPASSATRPASATEPPQSRSETMSGMPQAWTSRRATGRRPAGRDDRSASASTMAKDRRVISSGSRR